MNRAELLDLAARVEAAEGADRELDAEIAAAVRYAPKGVGEIWQHGMKANSPSPGHVECFTSLGTEGPWYIAPRYTDSLDAAVTLVPVGWRVNTADWSIVGRFTWMLKGPCLKLVPNENGGYDAGDDWYVSGISLGTPALALVAAALRARAAEAQT